MLTVFPTWWWCFLNFQNLTCITFIKIWTIVYLKINTGRWKKKGLNELEDKSTEITKSESRKKSKHIYNDSSTKKGKEKKGQRDYLRK